MVSGYSVWLGVMGLAAGCWQEDPLIDDTFTREEWTFLSKGFQLPAPQTCPDGFTDSTDCETFALFGKSLFFDKRIAGPILVDTAAAPGAKFERGKIACSSCHDPKTFFIDTRSQPSNVSVGAKITKHNAMSTVNLAYKSVIADENCRGPDPDLRCKNVYSWTGRYASPGAVLNLAGANAMNAKGEELSLVLHGDDYRFTYAELFGGFPPPCTIVPQSVPGQPPDKVVCDLCPMEETPCHTPDQVFGNVAIAFDAYVRRLTSVDSPFDRYVAGVVDANHSTSHRDQLTETQRRGLAVFIGKGMCVDCHRGPLLSDLRFHDTGVPQVGPNVPAIDEGLGAEMDANIDLAPRVGQFLTPPLRNVGKTAPYMHAGQLGLLANVIDFYRKGGEHEGFVGIKDARIQPLEITDDEARDLEEFLRTLTGTEDELKKWSP